MVNLPLNAQTMKDFDWLVGTWIRHHNNKTTYEVWEIENNQLIGKGITLQGTDTTFIELLKIERQGNYFFYIADVEHNPAPVLFKITVQSNLGFTAENPNHDFPKKINYSYEGDELKALISADGKEITFRFKRIH